MPRHPTEKSNESRSRSGSRGRSATTETKKTKGRPRKDSSRSQSRSRAESSKKKEVEKSPPSTPTRTKKAKATPSAPTTTKKTKSPPSSPTTTKKTKSATVTKQKSILKKEKVEEIQTPAPTLTSSPVVLLDRFRHMKLTPVIDLLQDLKSARESSDSSVRRRNNGDLLTSTVTRSDAMESSRMVLRSQESSMISTPAVTKTHARLPYSFGGPVGTTLMTLGMPLFVIIVNNLVKSPGNLRWPTASCNWHDYVDCEAWTLVIGWLAVQVVLALIPIGQVVYGQPLGGPHGRRLKYRCNGWLALLVNTGLVGALWYTDHLSISWVLKHWTGLIGGSTAAAFLISGLAYARAWAWASKHELAPEGNSGWFVYDFFMGRELNPRVLWGRLDLKFFFDFRTGLMAWLLLDIVFCLHQLETHCNPALMLVTLFHILYVVDALVNEAALLTTLDILHEGFGFMLAFGNLVFVPFVYTLTAHFLLLNPDAGHVWHTEAHWLVKWAWLAACSLLNLIGYVIFRASNSQKNAFRKEPHHPQFSGMPIEHTPTGTRLLAGGWWGCVRHPNYLGDILMSIAWSLPACWGCHLLPWVYPAFFIPFLVGRALRNEATCRQKHGLAWSKYTQRVPWRLLPKVF